MPKETDKSKLNNGNVKYLIVCSRRGSDFYFHEPSGLFADISYSTICDTLEQAEKLLEAAKEYPHEGYSLEIQRVRATFTLQSEEPKFVGAYDAELTINKEYGTMLKW